MNAPIKKTYYDQLGDSVTIPYPPQRIISLVPSQTELLFDLSLDDEVVGITKFCIHPEHWIKIKKNVGGTKNFRFDVIDDLKPDLIIGNKEENYRDGIDELKKKYPVWMSDIVTWHDALTMIKSIGELTHRVTESKNITEKIESSFLSLQKTAPQSVLYLIWKKPWMGAGHETFIDAILEKMGLVNSLKNYPRYPALNDQEIRLLKPDWIFLSSEPYPFATQHIKELKEITPTTKIILVDGEMFSWYGSRLLKATAYLNSVIELLRE